MRIIFVGASKFGEKILFRLCKIRGIQIAGIITGKENFSISYNENGVKNVLYTPFNNWRQQGIEVITMDRNPKEDWILEKIRRWNPDCFIVAGWYHMVPKIWRDIAPAYGMHASLLPKYSGGAPLVWAIINGEEKTGITLFQMDGGVDSGPIVGQKEVSIGKQETIFSLYEKIEKKAIELIEEYVPKISSKKFLTSVQDESQRQVWPQRCPEDGFISYPMEVEYMERFVRAQTKHPGAFIRIDDTKLKIWNASIWEGKEDIKEGYLYYIVGNLVIGGINGAITLEEFDIEGGKIKAETERCWIDNIEINDKGYNLFGNK